MMRPALAALVLWGALGSAVAADEIFDAARRGDVAAVKAALDAGTPVDAKWRYDQTALYIAVFRGHTDVVRLLLERGASPDARDTFYKMTALDSAANKNPEILGMLVAKGAKGGENLFPTAAAGGKKIVVQTLLANGKWPQDVLDESLLAAEVKKQTEIVAMLKDAGAKPMAMVELDAAAAARVKGSFSASIVPNPVTLTFEGGILRVTGAGPPMEFRPIDATTFVSVLRPRTDKLVFEVDNGQVKGFDFINGSNKFRFTPEAK